MILTLLFAALYLVFPEYLILAVNVPFLVKNRTKGIVSAANYLKEKYGNVRVITNSYEVEKTVNAQNNEGIKVILKKAKKAS